MCTCAVAAATPTKACQLSCVLPLAACQVPSRLGPHSLTECCMPHRHTQQCTFPAVLHCHNVALQDSCSADPAAHQCPLPFRPSRALLAPARTHTSQARPFPSTFRHKLQLSHAAANRLAYPICWS